MKSALLAFALLSAAANAQTLVTITNVQGRVYDRIQIVRTNDDGLIYEIPGAGGGGLINFATLSPSTLENLGIPTNRIDIAQERAKFKKERDAQWKAQNDAQAQLINAERQNAFNAMEAAKAADAAKGASASASGNNAGSAGATNQAAMKRARKQLKTPGQ